MTPAIGALVRIPAKQAIEEIPPSGAGHPVCPGAASGTEDAGFGFRFGLDEFPAHFLRATFDRQSWNDTLLLPALSVLKMRHRRRIHSGHWMYPLVNPFTGGAILGLSSAEDPA